MAQPVRTISLDDVNETDEGFDATGSRAYETSYQMRTGTSLPTGVTNPGGAGASPEFTNPSGTSAGSYTSGVTRMTEIFGRFGNAGRQRTLIFFGGILLVLGAALVFMSGEGSWVSDLLSGGSSESASPDTPAPMSPEKADTKTVAPAEVREPIAEDLVNPYWNLPNSAPQGAQIGPRGMISLGQEDRWRKDLAGNSTLRYDTYQRFQAVQAMREARLRGSESLLTEALSQPKFWTRMEALFALTELGDPPDVDMVQNAIGSTRRDLVKNYFKRFRKNSMPSELFVLKQAVRVVDAPSRMVILEVLAASADPEKPLYLVAAGFDPNPKIVAWSKEQQQKMPVSQALLEQFKRYASGQEKAPGVQGKTKPVLDEPKMQDLKIEELPHDVNVEEVYFLNEEHNVEPAEATPVETETQDGFETIKE